MELTGALSNPLVRGEPYSRLLEMKEKRLLGHPRRRSKPTAAIKLRTGAIQESVKHVLEVASKPMHYEEVHAAVQKALGRPIPRQAIRNCVRDKRTGLFDQVSPGYYTLHAESATLEAAAVLTRPPARASV
jgi:hypothetical protein